MPRFHVYQSPASVWNESVDKNHWATEELVFGLLNQFLKFRTGNSIPPEVRNCIKVCDSQVSHVSGLKQETEDNPQRRGKCLLHATCGDLVYHRSLSSLFESGDTISILTEPETEECGCTFGVVFLGHSRVVRKFQFCADKQFYTTAHVSGSGFVQSLAKSVDLKTTTHWEAITRLLCYFRPQGDATVKRAGGKSSMQQNGWMTEIILHSKRWLPEEMLSTQMHSGVEARAFRIHHMTELLRGPHLICNPLWKTREAMQQQIRWGVFWKGKRYSVGRLTVYQDFLSLVLDFLF